MLTDRTVKLGLRRTESAAAFPRATDTDREAFYRAGVAAAFRWVLGAAADPLTLLNELSEYQESDAAIKALAMPRGDA